MNLLDYALIGFMLLSTLIGLIRGLAREILSTIGMGAALLIAFLFSNRLAPLLENYLPLPSVRQIAAFIILFLLMLVAMAVFNYVISALIAATDTQGIDLFLGMIFGLIRGIIIIILLISLAGFTPFPKDQWWQESRLIPHFIVLAKWSCQFLPQGLHKLNSFCS